MTGRRSNLSRFPALIALLACSALAPSAWAQGKLDRELEFVRGLARELRFISLAQGELQRLEQTYKSGSDLDAIASLAVEVSLSGAQSRSDRNDQRRLYKEAIELSKALLERSTDPKVQFEARATLSNASSEFGRFLIEELEVARAESPDKVKELEEEAASVFRTGIEACEKLMQAIEGDRRKSPEKNLEYGLAWLRKCVLMREQGRAVKSEAGYLTDRARTDLEELVLDYGEETALGVRGLFEIAMCNEVSGATRDAIESYTSTITQIETSLDQAADLGFNADTEAFFFDMLQEVYSHAAEILFREGDVEGAKTTFDSFRKNMEKFGEKGADILDVADPRYGHLTLLSECQFMAESGDPAKVQAALELARKINDRHPADYVGVRAKAVIRDILSAQTRLVSGALLYEVAKGEQQNKNFEAAIIGFRKALAAMTPEEQKQFGLDSYDMMAKAYFQTERYLEAVLAFKEGLVRFGTEAANAETVADNLDRAMGTLTQVTKNDPSFDALRNEIVETVGKYGGAASGNKLRWKIAGQRMQERKYAEAAAEFAQVTSEFLNHELAMVRQATALQLAGDYAGAKKALDAYRAWLETKEAVLEPRRTDKATVRKLAMAEAAFRDAAIGYDEAVGAEKTGLKKDLTKYPAAIEKLRAFVTNHQGDGDQLLAYALDNLGRLHAELGELDKAENAYLQLREKDAAGTLSPRLATVVFDAYLNKVKSLEQEQAKAIADGKTSQELAPLNDELRSTRQRLVALGQEYIKASAKPQVGIMVVTMQQYELLADWAKVGEVSQRIIDLFGAETEKKTKDLVDLAVRPKIGEAMLRQKQFQQAYDMLVAAEAANPNQWELKRLISLALGGWLEFDSTGRPVKVPGLGKPKEAYDKFFGEYKTWALRPGIAQYSIEWYTFQWEAYWFALQAAPDNSTYKGYAQSLYRIARATDDFETLKSLGAKGLDLFDRFKLNPVQ